MTNFFTKFDGTDATTCIWVFFLVTLLLGFVLEWICCKCKSTCATPETKTVDPSPVAAAAPIATSAKDDLKKIEGIGPKIESLLNAAGIMTFHKLSTVDLDVVQKVLDDAGPRFRMHKPATWAKQADLAANGKWDELEEYQDYLDGGKDPSQKA